MDLLNFGQKADAVAAIVGAAIAIGTAWRWGLPAVRCALGRVRAVWSALERLPSMAHFLSPDNPEGVPAKFDQVLTQGEARGQQITRMDKKIDGVVNTQRAVMNTNPRVAAFEADDQGRYTVVNRTLLRWTGLPPSELLGFGWLNAIHPLDRAKVREEWLSAVVDCRRFECRFRIVNATSQAITEVDASADPIPEGTVPCERWYGTMYTAQSGGA